MRNCSIGVAKTKALISFAKLIWVFVFAYTKRQFSHDAAHIYSVSTSFYEPDDISVTKTCLYWRFPRAFVTIF